MLSKKERYFNFDEKLKCGCEIKSRILIFQIFDEKLDDKKVKIC